MKLFVASFRIQKLCISIQKHKMLNLLFQESNNVEKFYPLNGLVQLIFSWHLKVVLSVYLMLDQHLNLLVKSVISKDHLIHLQTIFVITLILKKLPQHHSLPLNLLTPLHGRKKFKTVLKSQKVSDKLLTCTGQRMAVLSVSQLLEVTLQVSLQLCHISMQLTEIMQLFFLR